MWLWRVHFVEMEDIISQGLGTRKIDFYSQSMAQGLIELDLISSCMCLVFMYQI